MEAMDSFGEIQGPSHFFKVILSSTLEAKMLGIPEKFVLKFGDELSAVAILTVPNGRVWQLGLKKEGKKIWFHEGWHHFVEFYSIAVGHLLVFKYEKGSNFHALIFDMSACEVEYPYNNGVTDNDKENLAHENGTEDIDSVERVSFTTPNPVFPSLKRAVIDDCPIKGSSSQMCTPSRLNMYKYSFKRSRKCVASSSKFKLGCGMRRKKCKVEEREIDESHDAKESREKKCKMEDLAKIEKSHDMKESRGGNLKINDEHQLFALLEDMEICSAQSFKYFTVEERERVVSAARLFKPKNPSFIVMLRASDMCRHYLYVPIKFAQKYFTGDDCITTLDFNGRKSSVHVVWNPGRCQLTRVGGFLKDNNLAEGDICVFEMLKTKKKKKTENTLLKLSVLSAL